MVLLCLLVVRGLAAEPSKLNIVFVLSDNQSYYEMGCHGHAELQTPHIDALAKQSLDFQNFYAPPFCSPSRAVLLTGQHAMRSGVHNTVGGRSILHKDKITLADVLKNAGYRTGIFGKWHLGFSYPYRPEDRGFEEVFVHGGGGIGQMEDHFGNTHYGPTFIHNGKPVATKAFSTDTLFDRAMAFIEANKDRRFFCYLPTPVTHSPHYGPRDLMAKIKARGVKGSVGLYAQVENLDANIGKLVKKIDELGLAKNTVLIYASDQGISDRGAPHGPSKQGLAYDAKHHVPFMVRMPTGTPGFEPGVCTRLTGMIDFFPTILDLCGVKSSLKVDGLSIKPLLVGEHGAFPNDRTLIIQCPRGRDAVKWKNASVKTERWRLTEGEKLDVVHVDPRMHHDVAAHFPEVVKTLREKYETYWCSMPDAAASLSRHLLGAEACPAVVLNGMDWYTGSQPWHTGHFKNGGNGAWAVEVARDGKYEIECRIFPREADKAMNVTHARLKIGDMSREQTVDSKVKQTTFTVDLKAGRYDLQTWLRQGGKERGALFVYVRFVR